MQRWPVTTEPHRTQSPSSELQSSTRRAKSEDPDPASTEIIKSNFQFSEQLFVQVKKDTEIFSKLTDQIPSANDHKYLNLIKAYLSIFISIHHINNKESSLCLNRDQSNIPPRSISYYSTAGGASTLGASTLGAYFLVSTLAASLLAATGATDDEAASIYFTLNLN